MLTQFSFVHKGEKTMVPEILKAFFFEAMRHGWTSDQAQFVTKEYDGWKEKTWVFTSPNFPNFQLIDQYRTFSNSRVSEGKKSISFSGIPVWYMVYGGWYNKQVIPFLKRALARNYNEGVFIGGRGPDRLEGEDHTLQYLNRVQQNDFANFGGHEWIEATSPHSGMSAGTKLGEHHYFGGKI